MNILLTYTITLYLLLPINNTHPIPLFAHGFEIPLPGGRSIKYNQDTGVLRINLSDKNDRKISSSTSTITIPPIGTKPNQKILNSIIVRDTGIIQKGFGAFATKALESGVFLGFYEGELIRTREKLDEIVRIRRKNDSGTSSASSGAMDYVMSLDGGVTFIDGFERAQNKNVFSTVHLNHADKNTPQCNCIRLLEDDRVAFFTSRVIEVDEELCFDYGSNFWSGRENEKV